MALRSGKAGPALLALLLVGVGLTLLFLLGGGQEARGSAPEELNPVEPRGSQRQAPAPAAIRRPPEEVAIARTPDTEAVRVVPESREQSTSAGEVGESREREVRVLAGRVIDATRIGEAVAGAAIFLNDPMEPDAEARTGADGSFELILPPGPIGSVLVRADGYAFERWTARELEFLSRDEEGRLFPLEPGAKLRGRVVDNHGEPLGEGMIVAYDEDGWRVLYKPQFVGKRRPPVDELAPLRDYDLRSSRLYQTGDSHWQLTNHPFARLAGDGTFALTDLPAGVPLHLYVEAERATRAFHEVFFEPGEDRETTITVQRAPVIRGHAALPELEGIINPGVWFCVHEEHVGLVVGADRWTPLQPGGGFSSGPLWPAEKVTARFTFETSDPVNGLRYYEKKIAVSLEPEGMLELDVDLSDASRSTDIPRRMRD